jgi:hypothetical protein
MASDFLPASLIVILNGVCGVKDLARILMRVMIRSSPSPAFLRGRSLAACLALSVSRKSCRPDEGASSVTDLSPKPLADISCLPFAAPERTGKLVALEALSPSCHDLRQEVERKSRRASSPVDETGEGRTKNAREIT